MDTQTVMRFAEMSAKINNQNEHVSVTFMSAPDVQSVIIQDAITHSTLEVLAPACDGSELDATAYKKLCCYLHYGK